MTLLSAGPTSCPDCRCSGARHTPDTSSPQIAWCHHCGGGCNNRNPAEVAEPVILGTEDFGHPPRPQPPPVRWPYHWWDDRPSGRPRIAPLP